MIFGIGRNREPGGEPKLTKEEKELAEAREKAEELVSIASRYEGTPDYEPTRQIRDRFAHDVASYAIGEFIHTGESNLKEIGQVLDNLYAEAGNYIRETTGRQPDALELTGYKNPQSSDMTKAIRILYPNHVEAIRQINVNHLAKIIRTHLKDYPQFRENFLAEVENISRKEVAERYEHRLQEASDHLIKVVTQFLDLYRDQLVQHLEYHLSKGKKPDALIRRIYSRAGGSITVLDIYYSFQSPNRYFYPVICTHGNKQREKWGEMFMGRSWVSPDLLDALARTLDEEVIEQMKNVTLDGLIKQFGFAPSELMLATAPGGRGSELEASSAPNGSGTELSSAEAPVGVETSPIKHVNGVSDLDSLSPGVPQENDEERIERIRRQLNSEELNGQ